jgi:hypothetical protein
MPVLLEVIIIPGDFFISYGQMNSLRRFPGYAGHEWRTKLNSCGISSSTSPFCNAKVYAFNLLFLFI